MTKPKKTMFIEGPVTADFIGNAIAKHASNKSIGAHQIFLGQIRADQTDDGRVDSIEFSAYVEMADKLYVSYREELFSRYELTCMHVYHTLGSVRSGEINLFVFVSSVHRKDAIAACTELVEWIKKEVPVWGKVILESQSINWKENK